MEILRPSLAFLGAPVASAAVIFTPLPASPTDFIRGQVELDFDGKIATSLRQVVGKSITT
jgi:hypothetical protein